LDELCPAFVFHIEQRHSQMIDQYRLLDAKTGMATVFLEVIFTSASLHSQPTAHLSYFFS
jgi:hypothetical protein